MKLRALGTGHLSSRHPLVPSAFLVQSPGATICIGCGPGIPAKLESLGITTVDVWTLLDTRLTQVGGLEEIAWRVSCGELPKQTLVGPASLINRLSHMMAVSLGAPITEFFDVSHTRVIRIEEEHFGDSIEFVPNYLGDASFGLSMENSGVFITGEAPLNEEFLHAYGSPVETILHSCTLSPKGHLSSAPTLVALQTLPVYMQSKIWLYGYENRYLETEDPLPMLFLPQGTWIFDSDRKEKTLNKERFIRENGNRVRGNQNAI